MFRGVLKQKRRGLAAALIVLVLAVAAISLASSRDARRVLDAIPSMYAELAQLPDFDSMKYRDGELMLDGAPVSGQAYPECAYMLAEKEIITIQKRSGDVYFVTRGAADNYSGYVLSQDSLIDMQDSKGTERVLDAAVSGWYCYMFYSV